MSSSSFAARARGYFWPTRARSLRPNLLRARASKSSLGPQANEWIKLIGATLLSLRTTHDISYTQIDWPLVQKIILVTSRTPSYSVCDLYRSLAQSVRACFS